MSGILSVGLHVRADTTIEAQIYDGNVRVSVRVAPGSWVDINGVGDLSGLRRLHAELGRALDEAEGAQA